VDATQLATLTEAAKLLATGGPTMVLGALLLAIHSGHLVLRREYKGVCDERDRLRSELDGVRASRDSVSAAAAHALDELADSARRSHGGQQ